MEYLNWELDVLSRAIVYANLSAAAANIGISQPQLSRIVARIEEELELVILDRAARNKSAWTTQGVRLVELYQKAERQFLEDVRRQIGSEEPKHLHMGTLEGLASIAAKMAHHVLQHSGVTVMEVNVYDLNSLEELFLNGSLDVIISSREIGKKKYRYVKSLGYQILSHEGSQSGFPTLSSYEFMTAHQSKRHRSHDKTCVSNSLAVRREWINSGACWGSIPSTLKFGTPKQSKSIRHAYMIGSENLPQKIWKLFGDITLK